MLEKAVSEHGQRGGMMKMLYTVVCTYLTQSIASMCLAAEGPLWIGLVGGENGLSFQHGKQRRS